MAAYLSDDVIESIMKEMTEAFGKPNVLSSEDIEAYYKIMRGFVTTFCPKEDFFAQCLVREMTEATWESLRVRRHKTVSVERKHRQSLEFQNKRKKLLEAKQEVQKKSEAERTEMQEKGELTPGFRKFELEWVLHDTAQEVDELLEQAADERDHSRALESGMDLYQQLDELEDNALDRRNDSLEQLERYREAQPKWVADEAMNDFLEAQFESDQAKSLAASLVPTSGENR